MKEIKAVIDLMTKHGLNEFELEREDFKIRIKRGESGHIPVSPSTPPAPLPEPAPPPVFPVAAPAGNTEDLPTIKAPIVGTLYLQSAPGAAPFVKVGSEVDEDTVVCIIEAMKIMNEIKAETRGTIVEILAENGKPVDFGRPLFKVRPR